MPQTAVSFPGIDLVNDVITNDNGTPVNSIPIINWVVGNPSFAILPSASGVQNLCTIADVISGYQITVNGGNPIQGETFDIMFPGNFSTHPIHRPK